MSKYKNKIIVTFSGGKDSLACLLWAIEKYGKENIVVVFCDTQWEHPITYLHIHEVMQKLNMYLITLRGKLGFVDLAKKKTRFPSTKMRYCTEELKTKPMIDFILDKCEGYTTIIQGIRKDESTSRSLMQKHCTYFKYYFTPYTDNNIKLAAIQKKIDNQKPLSDKEKKKYQYLQERIAKGKLDKKYSTYRKKDVIKFRENNVDDVLRPIFDWTGSDVMQYILEKGFKPNPLYYKGSKRVGCYPCIMCNHSEVKAMINFEPEMIERLRDAEKKVGRSFFPPSYIPKKYQTGYDTKSGKKFPLLEDVLKYLTETQESLFKEDENTDHRCMSFYGICE